MVAASPRLTLATVVLDCRDAHALAAFYGRLLRWPVTREEPDWVLMRDPAGGTGLSFQPEADYRPPAWPERGAEQQKMLHLDIRVDDIPAAVAHAVGAGAVLAGWQPQGDVRVVLDPAGHPLCPFAG